MARMKATVLKVMSVAPALDVKGGRLINNMPVGVSGIQAAANARKEMKREKKIEMMAEGYVRGEMRKEVMEKLGGMM